MSIELTRRYNLARALHRSDRWAEDGRHSLMAASVVVFLWEILLQAEKPKRMGILDFPYATLVKCPDPPSTSPVLLRPVS